MLKSNPNATDVLRSKCLEWDFYSPQVILGFSVFAFKISSGEKMNPETVKP